MAYCAECGAHYGDDDPVCSSCGRNLVQEFELGVETTPKVTIIEPQTEVAVNDTVGQNIEIVKLEASLGQYSKKPETTPADGFLEKPDVFEINTTLPEGQSMEGSHFQIDGHLGKGIIKPQKIELETDGVHFKYDTPSHNFIKAEPIKEKPQEYRVTSSDMESNTMEDVFKNKESLLAELLPPIRDNVEVSTEDKTLEDIPVGEEEPVPDGLTNELLLLMNEPGTRTESIAMETLTELTLPETELKASNDSAIIWEGAQTWLKIPLNNVYRVTNRSLIIVGKYNNKLLEVSLALITGVALRQSWFAKIFGVGDLLIAIPDFSAPKVVLKGIAKPAKVKQLLEDLCRNKV